MTKKVEDIDELMDEFGLILVGKLQEELRRQDKVFTKEAHDSIEYYPEDKVVGSKLNFIYNLEYGRKVGTYVPENELLMWVQGKLGIVDIDEAERVMRIINEKIFRKGIPMTRFAKITLEKLEK